MWWKDFCSAVRVLNHGRSKKKAWEVPPSSCGRCWRLRMIFVPVGRRQRGDGPSPKNMKVGSKVHPRANASPVSRPTPSTFGLPISSFLLAPHVFLFNWPLGLPCATSQVRYRLWFTPWLTLQLLPGSLSSLPSIACPLASTFLILLVHLISP